ncbi:CoA-disulfide reductase [Virgibacillus sp. W0430]|uniref:CoA-disulfide reductase n=1 Tax=Virgibacillus sp. W0430 TaxID=3391580 RepID=UPI003F489EC5
MRYVIIGGVAAGMSAAMQIVRTDKQADITVLEQGEYYSYGQCGLPYVLSGTVSSVNDVIARSVETFRNKYGIKAKTNTKVTHIDHKQQRIEAVESSKDDVITVPYDRLLIATGARPKLPDWEGSHLNGIHSLKTIPDTKAILQDLTHTVKKVVVVGGGYIGLEAAENFAAIGKDVRIIQRGEQVASIFDKEMAEMVQKEAEEKNIRLVLNESVEGFIGSTSVERVQTDKQTYAADLVLVAIGVDPNTDFLDGTGIHTMQNGAIIVNPFMETNKKNIYAAGDCATHYHRIKQENEYMPLGTTANKQGVIAGINMAGGTMKFAGIVGTSIIKFFDLTLGRTGLSEKEAASLNIPYATQLYEGRDIAGYYPNHSPLQIKLVYQLQTRQVLGAQIIGKNGVDKRIDVLATALYNEMTVDQLLHLDLAYAPPYNGVWDAIQQTARRI